MFNKINPVYIKVVGDALLPLLGYFFWDWSIYFILLFYILDFLVGEFLVHLKTKKIKNYYEKVVVSEWIKKGLLSAILIITALLGIHISMKMVEPTIVFSTEIMNFLSYEEMGIAQGYILLPLIFLMGYSQFKNEFLLPKKFKTVEFLELWKNHLVSRVLILALILPLALLAYFIQPTGFFYVLIIIIATSSYQLYMSKQ